MTSTTVQLCHWLMCILTWMNAIDSCVYSFEWMIDSLVGQLTDRLIGWFHEVAWWCRILVTFLSVISDVRYFNLFYVLTSWRPCGHQWSVTCRHAVKKYNRCMVANRLCKQSLTTAWPAVTPQPLTSPQLCRPFFMPCWTVSLPAVTQFMAQLALWTGA